MAVRIKDGKGYNIYHEPVSTETLRELARAQSAIVSIAHTHGDRAGFALDCIADIVHSLTVYTDTFVRLLIAYGEFEED